MSAHPKRSSRSSQPLPQEGYSSSASYPPHPTVDAAYPYHPARPRQPSQPTHAVYPGPPPARTSGRPAAPYEYPDFATLSLQTHPENGWDHQHQYPQAPPPVYAGQPVRPLPLPPSQPSEDAQGRLVQDGYDAHVDPSRMYEQYQEYPPSSRLSHVKPDVQRMPAIPPQVAAYAGRTKSYSAAIPAHQSSRAVQDIRVKDPSLQPLEPVRHQPSRSSQLTGDFRLAQDDFRLSEPSGRSYSSFSSGPPPQRRFFDAGCFKTPQEYNEFERGVELYARDRPSIAPRVGVNRKFVSNELEAFLSMRSSDLYRHVSRVQKMLYNKMQGDHPRPNYNINGRIVEGATKMGAALNRYNPHASTRFMIDIMKRYLWAMDLTGSTQEEIESGLSKLPAKLEIRSTQGAAEGTDVDLDILTSVTLQLGNEIENFVVPLMALPRDLNDVSKAARCLAQLRRRAKLTETVLGTSGIAIGTLSMTTGGVGQIAMIAAGSILGAISVSKLLIQNFMQDPNGPGVAYDKAQESISTMQDSGRKLFISWIELHAVLASMTSIRTHRPLSEEEKMQYNEFFAAFVHHFGLNDPDKNISVATDSAIQEAARTHGPSVIPASGVRYKAPSMVARSDAHSARRGEASTSSSKDRKKKSPNDGPLFTKCRK